MNTGRYILFAMAALAFASCEKSIEQEAGNEPVGEVGTIIFSATLDGKAPGSKAVIGTNPETGKPLNFWEDGDEITVYSQGKGDSETHAGYTFSTTLGANASSADFTYTGDGWVDGSAYMSIYPATGSRAVNFTGKGDVYKMAAVDVPHSQTLVANSFDRSAMVATAYSTDNTFAFKSAVALLKFRVSDTDIKGGTVVVANEAISGRFRADLSTTSPYEPTLTDYGQTTYDNVEFSIDGSTSLSTGTDYYIAVRPTELDTDLKVYLNGYLVKTVAKASLASIARNKIYNLGTLSKASAAEIVLHFDFTGTPPAVVPAWPTDVTKDSYPHVDGGIERVYPLYGTAYSFILADCGNATNTSAVLYWDTSAKRLAFNAQKRYLGFPIISGYKIKSVVCVDKTSSGTPEFAIVKSISANTSHPAASEIVCAKQSWSERNVEYTYDMPIDADAAIRYYLYAYVKGSIASITLTYEPE